MTIIEYVMEYGPKRMSLHFASYITFQVNFSKQMMLTSGHLRLKTNLKTVKISFFHIEQQRKTAGLLERKSQIDYTKNLNYIQLQTIMNYIKHEAEWFVQGAASIDCLSQIIAHLSPKNYIEHGAEWNWFQKPANIDCLSHIAHLSEQKDEVR